MSIENKNIDLSSLKIDRSSKKLTKKNDLKIKKIITPLIVFIFIVFAIYFVWTKIFTSVIKVNLITVSKISINESNAVLTASGYVVAQRKASVGSKATGRLVYLGVVEGDKVKKNQVIARIENADVLAQIEQAKANLRFNEADLVDAKNKYEREQKLFKAHLSAQAPLDAALARLNKVLALIDLAKAQVNSAKVALEFTLIRSPFDGTVLTKNADVGEIISPLGASSTSRSAVVTIADMNSLQVEADVSESNIERIKAGQNCEISLDAYPNIKYPGYVAKIVPTADRSKATVLVKVAFKKYDSRVLPEMSAKVLFLNFKDSSNNEKQLPVLAIPILSIKTFNNKKYVYTVNDNILNEKEITTGKKMGNYIEVLSGISEGDKIISNINKEIVSGQKVKIL